jgi:hypothetical protein
LIDMALLHLALEQDDLACCSFDVIEQIPGRLDPAALETRGAGLQSDLLLLEMGDRGARVGDATLEGVACLTPRLLDVGLVTIQGAYPPHSILADRELLIAAASDFCLGGSQRGRLYLEDAQ